MEAVAAEPVATCAECGVRVRFMPGFEPRLRGWRGGTCPACRMREARARLDGMSTEEKRGAVIDELRREPTASARQLCRVTGIDRSTVLAAREEAVRLGIALDPEPDRPRVRKRKPPDAAKAERAAAREQRKRSELDADAALLREHPGITSAEFRERLGVSLSVAKRRVGRLVAAGLARRETVYFGGAGRGRRVTYEPVSTPEDGGGREPPPDPSPPPLPAVSHP